MIVRRVWFFSLILVLIVSGYIAYYYLRTNFRYDWNRNEIHRVKRSEILLRFKDENLEKGIKIYSSNSKYPQEPIVEFGERSDNPLLMQYGDEVFKVYFEDKVIGSNSLRKYNWWQDLKYSFDFKSIGDSIFYDFKVEPLDSVTIYSFPQSLGCTE